MPIQTKSGPTLKLTGVVSPLYSTFITHVYNTVRGCQSLADAKRIQFTSKKPGSIYVCSDGKSIIFFERADQVFARIDFNPTSK